MRCKAKDEKPRPRMSSQGQRCQAKVKAIVDVKANDLINKAKLNKIFYSFRISRYQCLSLNPNWLVVWKGIPPPKTRSNFPWDNELESQST